MPMAGKTAVMRNIIPIVPHLADSGSMPRIEMYIAMIMAYVGISSGEKMADRILQILNIMEEIVDLYFLAQTGYGDAEPVAVFGNGAPGQFVALLLQPGQYGLVAQGGRRVFGIDQLAYGREYGAR